MNSSVKTINKALLACPTAMLLACVLVVSSAFADDQVRSETVKFQDLNTGTPAGAEALYFRIHSAAKRVCSRPGDAWEMFHASTCIKDAEAGAIQKVDLPLLTAYYRTKTGGQKETLTAKR
jgi:UrcA family protein